MVKIVNKKGIKEHQQLGVIQYIDGHAWAPDELGKTVCVGSEHGVRKALDENMVSGNYVIDQIIRLEKMLS